MVFPEEKKEEEEEEEEEEEQQKEGRKSEKCNTWTIEPTDQFTLTTMGRFFFF